MVLEPNKLERLRTQVCGALILPGHGQYDASREIWNRFFDRRPSVIVRCTSTADVVAAIRFAREHDLEIAIKSGGHHAAGHASTDGGILLDLTDEAERVCSAHGPENYRRLRELKSRYDPSNVFHNNPNVLPMRSGPMEQARNSA